MKIWKDGLAEPSAWLAEASDSHPSLQAVGSVGLRVYVSGGATNAPFRISAERTCDFAPNTRLLSRVALRRLNDLNDA